MIPASVYASGLQNGYWDSAAFRGMRANARLNEQANANGILAANSAPVIPGRALFFTNTNGGNNSAIPVPVVTSTTPASVAANFAGVLSGDLWQERPDDNIPLHTAAYPQFLTVTAKPQDMVPRAVEDEIWVEVDNLGAITRNGIVHVITAAGALQGAFSGSAAGNLALPVSAIRFTGRTATNFGILHAAVLFPSV